MNQYSRSNGRFSDLEKPLRRHGIALFYEIVEELLVDDIVSCPSIRNFASFTLDALGSSVIAKDSEQCLRLVKATIKRPICHSFLVPSYTPNVADSNTFLEIYRIINELPEKHAQLAFVLLSKVSIESWLSSNSPLINVRSRLIALIGDALKKTGIKPDESRVLLHAMHVKHFLALTFHDFPKHFLNEVIPLLMSLSEEQSLDPNVWFDLLNQCIVFGCRGNIEMKSKIDETKEKNWAATFKDFSNTQTQFSLIEVIYSTLIQYNEDSYSKLIVF